MSFCVFFFFNDTATTEIYTLSLHDALPIFGVVEVDVDVARDGRCRCADEGPVAHRDRKSTRLNSSHTVISYAVFCLKKKKKKKIRTSPNEKRLAPSTISSQTARTQLCGYST